MSDIFAIILDFQKLYFKQNCGLKTSRKHVFTASNTNIIKNRVKKKKLEQFLLERYSFLFQTLICIINVA